MPKRTIIMVAVADLRPHPINKELYGPPTANSAYKDIKANMEHGGFDERHPLLVTEDRRILWGVTRWSVAKSLHIAEVPCEVFIPTSPQTAELEIEGEVVRGNMYRVKTQLTIARKQRKLLEVEKALARERMAVGSDGGPSKATDRVGTIFAESGKTVQRRLKVLKGIERAESRGQTKLADRLTELLERKSVIKAIDLLDGKKKGGETKKMPAVEVPPTFLDHNSRAFSEFFDAACKATIPAELELLAKTIDQLREVLEQTRQRLASGVPAGLYREDEPAVVQAIFDLLATRDVRLTHSAIVKSLQAEHEEEVGFTESNIEQTIRLLRQAKRLAIATKAQGEADGRGKGVGLPQWGGRM